MPSQKVEIRFSCFTLFVFPVVIGMSDYRASVAFMYMNTVVNGLQGFGIFLIYCVISREIRGGVKGIWKRSRAGSKLDDGKTATFGQELRKKSTVDSNIILGVHHSTPGKFTELPI